VLDHVVPQRQESDQPALAPQHGHVAFADHVPGEVPAIFGVAVQPGQPRHRRSSRRSEHGGHGVGISASSVLNFHHAHDRAQAPVDIRHDLDPARRPIESVIELGMH
jgi:hypothetical protein